MLGQMPQGSNKAELEIAIKNYLLRHEHASFRRERERRLYSELVRARREGFLVDGSLFRLIREVESYHSLRAALLHWPASQILDWALVNLANPSIVSRLRYFEASTDMWVTFKVAPVTAISDHVDQHMFGAPPSPQLIDTLRMYFI
jgi:hypothetical protein